MQNVVIVIHDGFGHYANADDWCTDDSWGLKEQFNSIRFAEDNFLDFTKAISPAVSTIMSIESILSGVYAAKAHKLHWREWPTWDRLNYASISDVLEGFGYSVNGFSYLLNSENWMPSIRCYKPELYENYPSEKKDTHSYEAVISAFRDYFQNSFQPHQKQCLIVHSVYIYKFWDEMNEILTKNGLNSENTIMAVTADHYFPESFGRFLNYELQNGRSLLHHTDLTECNTRVPLYLRYPGSKYKKISRLVSGYDLAPTIADLLGILEVWPNQLDGKSLLKSDENNLKITRTDNVYPFQIGEIQGRITSVRDDVFKLVIKPDPPSSYVSYRFNMGWNIAISKMEFYNLNDDPREKNNILDRNNMTETEQQAFNRLNSFFCETNRDILNHHLNTMLHLDEVKKLTIINSKKILIIQNTHDEIFLFISNLIGKLSYKKIAYVCNVDLNNKILNSNMKISSDIFFENIKYQKELLLQYDFVIIPASQKYSFFGNVYNDSFYIDRSNELIEIAHNNTSSEFYTLGLDLNLKKFPFVRSKLINKIRHYITVTNFILNKIKNLKKIKSDIGDKYSKQIIVKKQ